VVDRPYLPNVVQWAIPLYVLAILVEMALSWWRGWPRYELRDTATSLSMAVAVLLAGPLALLELGVLDGLQRAVGLFDWGWSPAAFAACFVLDDLRKYWLHRTQHRVRWFWTAHVTHHSSQHLNFSTALRNPPTQALTAAFLFRLPLALLGFPIEMIVFVAGLDSVYQFFTHTESIGRLPWFIEAVWVTPSHHRVHHAVNPRYLDCNYGSVFSLWDRLFGTYVPEDASDPPRYGLVTQLATFSPLRVAFHEWAALFSDLTQPGLSWGQRARLLWAEPGWSPRGDGETTEAIRARHAACGAQVTRRR
jgi:sterol desaturase/sphingolipid hydroxylase (fatty acid hydroxylase superfamily)